MLKLRVFDSVRKRWGWRNVNDIGGDSNNGIPQGGPLDTNLDAGGNSITNLGDIDFDNGYVDISYDRLRMHGNKIIEVDDPQSDQDVATKKYVDDKSLSASSLADVLNVGNDANGMNIENLADPSTDQQAATKAYVDSIPGPRGDPGEQGPQGDPGETGPQGEFGIVKTATFGGYIAPFNGAIVTMPLQRYPLGSFPGWDDWEACLASDGDDHISIPQDGVYRVWANCYLAQPAEGDATYFNVEMIVTSEYGSPGSPQNEIARGSGAESPNSPTSSNITRTYKLISGDTIEIKVEADVGIVPRSFVVVRFGIELLKEF